MIGNLELIRVKRTEYTTIGELFLNGIRLCYTLEDFDRGLRSDMDLSTLKSLKKAGKTAIPIGTYDVRISMSNRFKKLMPEILKVPGFEGVRIHSGNKHEDTEGCPLVGLEVKTDWVGKSKDAFIKLMQELEKYDKFTIVIKNKVPDNQVFTEGLD